MIPKRIALIILSLIFLTGAIFFVMRTYGNVDSVMAKRKCQQSVQINTRLEPKDAWKRRAQEVGELVDPYGNPVKLECSTQYKTCKEEDPEKIKEYIAQEMLDCWEMFGEGEKELFETKDHRFCVVCSRVEFEEDVEIHGFTEFLMKNRTIIDSESYWERLMGIHTDGIKQKYNENSQLKEFDKFTTDFPLAVIYYMDKDAYPDVWQYKGAEAQDMGKTAKAVQLGSMAGAGGFAAGTTLVVGCAVVTGGVCGVVSSMALIGASTVGGAALGAGGGYAMGSDRSALWDARILLWNYNDLEDLNCTYLEGEATPLKVRSEEYYRQT